MQWQMSLVLLISIQADRKRNSMIQIEDNDLPITVAEKIIKGVKPYKPAPAVKALATALTGDEHSVDTQDMFSLEDIKEIADYLTDAELPPEGVDFKEIEEALGFKLFIWQKYFIVRGIYRRTGLTTAKAIRRLLKKDEPLDMRNYRPTNSEERFEMKETLKIYGKLQAAGVETCKVIMPRRRIP